MKILLLYFLLFTSILSAQTTREKIGQMVMVGFIGNSLQFNHQTVDTLKVDLRQRNLGGVILMGVNQNLQSISQMKALTDTLQKYSSTPLFISTDQEGGNVARLNSSNGFLNTSTAFRLGTTLNREDSTRRQASIMAGWLKQVGINTNFAPVVDVNVNPQSPAIGRLERSFSSDTIIVYNHAKWFVDEFKRRDIITTMKHFPGHGSATVDSHLGFTDITSTWRSLELYPYKRLVNENYVDMIMTGHLFNRNFDSTYPATLSFNTITNLLRNQIGYNGVVISDAMFMGAIVNNYSFEDAIVLTINAGVDILLYTTNLTQGTEKHSITRRIIEIVERKISEGVISPNRINESYNRIMQLKSKYLQTSIASDDFNQPNSFEMKNYPNPFNPNTKIRFAIPSSVINANSNSSQKNNNGISQESFFVMLKIYDILGNEVATLLNEEKFSGVYEIDFNGANLSSGIYFSVLRVNDKILTNKMLLLR